MIQVPVERIRPIVEAWLAEYESGEDAYRALATASSVGADSWRFRLSEGFKQSGGFLSRGWFTYQVLPESDVDEFLAAADLIDLWYSTLADLRVIDDSKLKWCPQCQMWLSVKAFHKSRSRPDGLYGWCGACKTADVKRRANTNREAVRAADRERYRLRGKRRPVGYPRRWKTPRVQPRRVQAKMTAGQVAAAYRIYQSGRSVYEIADLIWERFGYVSARSCENSLRESFHRDGLPLRSKSEAQLLKRAA